MNQTNTPGNLCPDTKTNAPKTNTNEGNSPKRQEAFVQAHIEDIRQLISNMKGYLRPGEGPVDGHPEQ